MSNPEKYLGKTLENKNQIFELLVGKAYIIEFIIYIYIRLVQIVKFQCRLQHGSQEQVC